MSGEKNGKVLHRWRLPLPVQAGPQLQEASGAGGGDKIRLGLAEAAQQAGADFFGKIRVGKVEKPAHAATLRAGCGFVEEQAGGDEQATWRCHDPVLEPEVTGVMVVNGWPCRLRRRRLE